MVSKALFGSLKVRGGFGRNERKNWKKWRALGREDFEEFSLLHNTKSP